MSDEIFYHISRDVFRDYSKAWLQEEFYDVTLVGDDWKRVSAHKLVLFAESEFCQKKLTKATTELSLQGVNSKDINNVLRFIYNGNVEVRNDELTGFLQIARKLELKNLRFPKEDSKEAFEATDEETDTHSQKESEKVTGDDLENVAGLGLSNKDTDEETDVFSHKQSEKVTGDDQENVAGLSSSKVDYKDVLPSVIKVPERPPLPKDYHRPPREEQFHVPEVY